MKILIQSILVEILLRGWLSTACVWGIAEAATRLYSSGPL